MMKRLNELTLQHHFHNLGNAFYTEHQPQGLQQPRLVRTNRAAAEWIGLDPTEFTTDLFLQVFSGNTLLPGMQPLRRITPGISSATSTRFSVMGEPCC